MKQRGFTLVIYAFIAMAVLGLLSAFVFGIYHKGYAAGSTAVKVQWDAANKAQRDAEAKKADNAARLLETTRARDRVIVKTVTKEVDRLVDRPVYRNVCLEPDGLRVARCAIRGEEPASCKLDEPVRPSPGPAGRNGGGLAALDH